MPQVPVYDQRQVAPQGFPRARVDERANEESFGASVGRALEHAANVANELAQHERRKADTARLLEADREYSNYEIETIDRGALSRRGKDAIGITPDTLREFDREGDRIERSLANDEQRLRFRAARLARREQVARKLNSRERAEIEAYQAQEAKAYDLATMESAASNWSDPIRVDEELARGAQAIRDTATLTGEPPVATEQRLALHRSQTHLAVLRAAAAAGENVYTEEYFGDRQGEMQAEDRLAGVELVREAQVTRSTDRILTAFRDDTHVGNRELALLEQSKLTPEQRDVVRSRVREGRNLLRSERKAEWADTLVDLSRQVAADDPSHNAERVAYGLYRRGAFSVDELESTIGSITRARTARARSDADLETVRQALTKGTRLDPKDEHVRKGVDQLFRSSGLTPDAANYADVAAEIAAKTNVVPNSALSSARASLLSERPADVVQGANLLARVQEAAPVAFGFAVDEKTQALAAAVNDAVRAGTPPALAVELAQRDANRTDAERKQLAEAYQAGEAAKGNAAALDEALDGDDRYDRSLFGGAPAAPMALRAEFDAAVKRYFPFVGGDGKRARELAFRDVRRKWGYSTINGAPELLPWAPEQMYGVTRDLVQADLEKVLSASPVVREDVTTGKKSTLKPEELRLIPSAATARTDGREWAVGYLDEYGAVEILRGADSAPLRYQLPVGQDFKAARAALADKELAKARATAKKQREFIENLEDQAKAGDQEAERLLDYYQRPAEGIR